MLAKLTRIHALQVYRQLVTLGLLRLVFLLSLVAFAAVALYHQTAVFPNAYYTCGIYLLLLVGIHCSRKDIRFLHIVSSAYRVVIAAEYLTMLLPLLGCLLWHKQWATALSAAFIGIAVSHIPARSRQKVKSSFVQKLVPDFCFEWKAGVRNTLIFMSMVWIASLSTSFFVGSVPVALLALGFTTIGFYERSEPLAMLLVFEKSSAQLLRQKLWYQVLLYAAIALPLAAAFLIFHVQLWYIAVGCVLLMLSIQLYAIVVKYAFYEPAAVSQGAKAFMLFGILGIVLPFLIPVVWIMTAYFYVKAKQNLNLYLYDYS